MELEGKGFVEHEVTDIRHHDTKDTERLVWFTLLKAPGELRFAPLNARGRGASRRPTDSAAAHMAAKGAAAPNSR